jgi:hypothetical protein
MFVRRKTVRGKAYFALVENRRVDGKGEAAQSCFTGRFAGLAGNHYAPAPMGSARDVPFRELQARLDHEAG